MVEASERFRKELPAGHESMVVICLDDGGNPVGFLPDAPTIFCVDHDFGGRHDLAASFSDYLNQLLPA